jgi:hypothetical protein
MQEIKHRYLAPETPHAENREGAPKPGIRPQRKRAPEPQEIHYRERIHAAEPRQPEQAH